MLHFHTWPLDSGRAGFGSVVGREREEGGGQTDGKERGITYSRMTNLENIKFNGCHCRVSTALFTLQLRPISVHHSKSLCSLLSTILGLFWSWKWHSFHGHNLHVLIKEVGEFQRDRLYPSWAAVSSWHMKSSCKRKRFHCFLITPHSNLWELV